MLVRKHVVQSATEATQGTDALNSLSVAAQNAAALSIYEPTFSTERETIERDQAGSTLSKTQPDQMGVGTSSMGFKMDLRGTGTATETPEWDDQARSCGMQVSDASAMTITLDTSGSKFAQAEQVYGEVAMVENDTNWDDVEGGTAAVSGVQPTVGKPVVFYPVGGSASKATASGTITVIEAGTVNALFRLSVAGRVNAGDMVRCETSTGVYTYNTIVDDMPTGIIATADHSTPAESALKFFPAHGVFAVGDEVVGHFAGTVGVVKTGTVSTTAGKVYRPNSTKSITFPLGIQSYSTPQVGSEFLIISSTKTGVWDGSAKILALTDLASPAAEPSAYVDIAGTTAVTMTGHGLTTAALVTLTLAGVTPSSYNGVHTGAVVDANTILLTSLDISGGAVTVDGTAVSASWGCTAQVSVNYGDFASGTEIYDSVALSFSTLSATPTADGIPSLTLWSTIDGFRRKLMGGHGNMSLELEAGKPATFGFEFQGSIGGYYAVDHPDSLAMPTTIAPKWAGAESSSYYGIFLRAHKFSLDLGNDIQQEPDANADDGLIGFNIGNRAPSVSFTIARAGLTGWQWELARDGGTWRSCAQVVGTVAGNQLAIVCPRLQIADISDGDENGTLSVDVNAKCIGISGDDEVLIFSL